MQTGILEKYGVELIGAKLPSINRAEDRQIFRDAMTEIGLKTPTSGTATNMDEAYKVPPVYCRALEREIVWHNHWQNISTPELPKSWLPTGRCRLNSQRHILLTMAATIRASVPTSPALPSQQLISQQGHAATLRAQLRL